MTDTTTDPMVEEEPTPQVRVVNSSLQAPSSHQGLLEVFKRHYLLRLLVKREISARYQGSLLGLLWSYINPLSQFFIYYVVMGFIFNLHKGVPAFAIHVFSALVIVHFFTETFNAGTRSIVRNKPLVRKLAMPREMFPVASMLVSLFHVGPQIVILLVACVAFGWSPDPVGMAAMVLAIALIMVLGTALALLFSVANVFFRDFSSAVSVLTNFVRFGVPMMYPYTQVAERFHGHTELYLANPISIAVLLFQRAFWIGCTPDPTVTAVTNLPDHLFQRGFIALACCAVLLVVAQVVFSRLENKIPERL